MTTVRSLLHNQFLLMILCCLVPIAAMGAVFLFGVRIGTAALIGIVVLCPLSYLLLSAAVRPQRDPQLRDTTRPPARKQVP